jgi:hypothetical protein
MTPDQVANAVSKPLSILKDLPAWFLSGVACAAAILLFVPSVSAQLPAEARPYLWVTVVLFGCLAPLKWLAVVLEALRDSHASRRPKKTFHLTAMSGTWHLAKQTDGSTVVQIAGDLLIKSQHTAPIGIAQVRIIRPRRLRGDVVHASVMVGSEDDMYGTAFVSGHTIPPGMFLPARAMVMVRCHPPRAQGRDLPVQLALADDEGNEQRVWITCKGQPVVAERDKPIPFEPIHAIEDPIAKNVVAILQAEMARYDKNGRTNGGLGSVHVTISGAPNIRFGQDSWQANSTSNQEIHYDPAKSIELHSDNLEAMLKLHGRLAKGEERSRLSAALRDRLGKPSYARVSYFIVCVLWRLGDLETALSTAAPKLPREDMRDFGLSNILYMLNGLLRYIHPDFSEADLDCIEKLVDRVGPESFHIRQKIAAIRAWRVHPQPVA